MSTIKFSLDLATILQFTLAIILPLLVGLVTTRVAPGGHKAVLLAGLSLITSLVAELARAVAAGVTYDLGVGLFLALPTFVIAVSTHYGLWKPTGTAEAAQKLLITDGSNRS